MSRREQAAWDQFWSQSRTGSGCLPGSSAALEQAQQRAWQDFSKLIPAGAKVLDLATGDGRVMAWLRDLRRDCKLTGVDLARQLPTAPRGTLIVSDVELEALPFDDHSFDAVVSQFGFEYADQALAARELARVLSPDGVAGLLTHRQDGPILRHNLARAQAISWAIDERALPAKAKQGLALRGLGVTAIPPAFQQAPAEGAAKFGNRSAAWEIAEAVRQTLVLGARDHPSKIAAALDTIDDLARQECTRIKALEGACKRLADDATFMACLESAALVQISVVPVIEAGAPAPVADFRILRPR